MEKQGLDREIIDLARRTKHYTELLIEQCNHWLPAEEGNRIMEKQIIERRRMKSAEEISNRNE